MACFSRIHHAIARLQAVSASPLPPELICIGPLRFPLEKKLQAFAHHKRPGTSSHSAVHSGLLVFAAAAAGQDAATSTLVLQEVDFVWKGEGSQVLLTGDFLGWDTKVSLLKGADGAFHYKQKLSPGTYNYKYIIDGEWVHSPDSPTIADGKGGFNNKITVTEGPSNLPNSKSSAEAASKEVPTASAKGTTKVDGMPKAAPKAAPAAKPAKKVEKPYPQMIIEDVVPKVKSNLQKEEDITDVNILFQDNQLEGSFMKKGIIYTFWAFFPDGKLEGARGFSLSSHGAPPSTVEPFLIDEKKITADLLIFWIMKRLYAQNLLSLN
eukprot:c22230_g1_i1 orf=465-1433(-)